MAESGIARRINRSVLGVEALDRELAGDGRRRRVLDGLTALLARRREVPAFSPWAGQEVLDLDPRVFAVRRVGDDGSSVVSLTNVTGESVSVRWPGEAVDLLGRRRFEGSVVLDGYAVRWLVGPTQRRQ